MADEPTCELGHVTTMGQLGHVIIMGQLGHVTMMGQLETSLDLQNDGQAGGSLNRQADMT